MSEPTLSDIRDGCFRLSNGSMYPVPFGATCIANSRGWMFVCRPNSKLWFGSPIAPGVTIADLAIVLSRFQLYVDTIFGGDQDAMSAALNEAGKLLGVGGCQRCGDRWNWKPKHVTTFAPNQGCFPLCEECWQSLKTPEAREVFYETLLDSWEQAESEAAKTAPRPSKKAGPQTGPLGAERRELVRAAVRAGL